MYNHLYSFYPQNVYYPPQIFAPEVQFSYFYPQLPTTYQNEFSLFNLQFSDFTPERTIADAGQAQNQQENKSSDTESTLEKSEEKLAQKKLSIFKYPKKNAESNIINQIFSFLSLRTKSEPILEKILQSSQEKIENFYEVLKQLKKRNKKYINRCYIRDLVVFQSGHIGHKIIQEIKRKGSKKALTVEEFKKALRILVSYYLKEKCISTVVTSRKLDKETMREHLHRKREVHEYFNTQMQILRETGNY